MKAGIDHSHLAPDEVEIEVDEPEPPAVSRTTTPRMDPARLARLLTWDGVLAETDKHRR